LKYSLLKAYLFGKDTGNFVRLGEQEIQAINDNNSIENCPEWQ